jgi:hypothetical protein
MTAFPPVREYSARSRSTAGDLKSAPAGTAARSRCIQRRYRPCIGKRRHATDTPTRPPRYSNGDITRGRERNIHRHGVEHADCDRPPRRRRFRPQPDGDAARRTRPPALPPKRADRPPVPDADANFNRDEDLRPRAPNANRHGRRPRPPRRATRHSTATSTPRAIAALTRRSQHRNAVRRQQPSHAEPDAPS